MHVPIPSRPLALIIESQARSLKPNTEKISCLPAISVVHSHGTLPCVRRSFCNPYPRPITPPRHFLIALVYHHMIWRASRARATWPVHTTATGHSRCTKPQSDLHSSDTTSHGQRATDTVAARWRWLSAGSTTILRLPRFPIGYWPWQRSFGAGWPGKRQGRKATPVSDCSLVGDFLAKCFRKVQRDTIQGVTKGDIRRLARRGGVKRISATIYDEIRSALRDRLSNVRIRSLCLLTSC